MLKRLRNQSGELCMVVLLVGVVVTVGLIEGFGIYKAKPKTVDTEITGNAGYVYTEGLIVE